VAKERPDFSEVGITTQDLIATIGTLKTENIILTKKIQIMEDYIDSELGIEAKEINGNKEKEIP